MKISENVPLSSLTTMRLGGPARYVLEVESHDDITYAYNFAKNHALSTFVLGGGANTIAHDEGFNGVIIKNAMKGITEEDGIITAMGGTEWDEVVEYACRHEYTGIEALSKIPGSAGAAPVQNIGAYGQDLSQNFVSAEVYDSKIGEFKTISKDDFHFSYRKSIMNTTEKNRYFIISISLALKVGRIHMKRPFYKSIEKYIFDHNETVFTPLNIRKIVSAIRADKLPDPKVIASAGSFFKNIYITEEESFAVTQRGIPIYRSLDGIKINSGWLIEQCGLAGQLYNGIRVNEKAALVLINESAKSYSDLAATRDFIITTVFNTFGYHLEQEPVELIDNSQKFADLLNS